MAIPFRQKIWNRVQALLHRRGYTGLVLKVVSSEGEPYRVHASGDLEAVKRVVKPVFQTQLREIVREALIEGDSDGPHAKLVRSKTDWPTFTIEADPMVWSPIDLKVPDSEREPQPESKGAEQARMDRFMSAAKRSARKGIGPDPEEIAAEEAAGHAGLGFTPPTKPADPQPLPMFGPDVDDQGRIIFRVEDPAHVTKAEADEIGRLYASRRTVIVCGPREPENASERPAIVSEVAEAPESFTSFSGVHEPDEEALKTIADQIGSLVCVKNRAYGNAFHSAGPFLSLLYPNGVQPDQFGDMLAIVRIFDKLKRIATHKDALGESPFRDIAGYCLLAIERDEHID